MAKIALPKQKLLSNATTLSDVEFWYDKVLSVHHDAALRKSLKWAGVNPELKKVGHKGIRIIKKNDDLSDFPINKIILKENPSISSFFRYMRNAFAHNQVFIEADPQGNEFWKLLDVETHDPKAGKKHSSPKPVMMGSIYPSQFRALVTYLLIPKDSSKSTNNK